MNHLRLYGVPLSQPVRSVAWTLLQLELPFTVELTVPGATSQRGTRHEHYTSKTPLRAAHVPLLEYNDDKSQEEALVRITESPAILSHICERQPPQHTLYPAPGTADKAQVDSYLHWHHGNTRCFTKPFAAVIRNDLNATVTAQDKARVHSVLQTLDTGWLGSSSFVGGLTQPTIADILAYGEVVQLVKTNLLLPWEDSDYPRLQTWMQHMAELPYHDEAHVALTVLGDLTRNDDDDDAEEIRQPLEKRLAAATKAGLQAWQEAQSKYTTRL